MAKIHVAFGFHVNLYHSFREDTNDVKGFAGDIRVIRHIIDVLNAYNEKGVAVKGTWDFENAFSLEETLPEFAPDIIENVKKRVHERGDENILMGYNNGAMGAKTSEELAASVKWAITNEKGSGIQDIFGTYAPLLRPQEMMFSPSQAATYKQLGIDALCLYYSAIPFDGFRTLIPLLDEKYAFNPLNYAYHESSITIVPTYNTGDLIDFGSLREQVKKLHAKQKTGEIDTDVLIYINMDADSEHWFGLGYPYPLNKLPNMTGLVGLIEEINDLPYVVFDTPGNYLKHHPPLKTISFSQDIADGSFDGYTSWSEKPFNRQIWTRLERARLLPVKAGMDQLAFQKRIRLLSTTHFGLSTPHLNINREKKALELSASLLDCLQMGGAQASWQGGKEEQLRYCLPTKNLNDPQLSLPAGMTIKQPEIDYQKQTYPFKETATAPLVSTINGYVLQGECKELSIELPGQREAGKAIIHQYVAKGISAHFFSMTMQYPYTPESAYVFNEIAALQRPQDDGWNEVRPMEICFEDGHNAIVMKRNYEGDISEFTIASFSEADSRNQQLDAFNHQISNGIIGVRNEAGGFLLATQKQVANSMAFCPMRLREGRLYINPFGTYGGKQRHHATHGNGLAAKVSVYAAPQYYPLAPAYNGAQETFMLALFPFIGMPSAALWEQAIDFADGNLAADELTTDFCFPHAPVEISEKIKLKKMTAGIPLSLQGKILIRGLKSRIKWR